MKKFLIISFCLLFNGLLARSVSQTPCVNNQKVTGCWESVSSVLPDANDVPYRMMFCFSDSNDNEFYQIGYSKNNTILSLFTGSWEVNGDSLKIMTVTSCMKQHDSLFRVNLFYDTSSVFIKLSDNAMVFSITLDDSIIQQVFQKVSDEPLEFIIDSLITPFDQQNVMNLWWTSEKYFLLGHYGSSRLYYKRCMDYVALREVLFWDHRDALLRQIREYWQCDLDVLRKISILAYENGIYGSAWLPLRIAYLRSKNDSDLLRMAKDSELKLGDFRWKLLEFEIPE